MGANYRTKYQRLGRSDDGGFPSVTCLLKGNKDLFQNIWTPSITFMKELNFDERKKREKEKGKKGLDLWPGTGFVCLSFFVCLFVCMFFPLYGAL